MSEIEDLLRKMTAKDDGWATERTAKDILAALYRNSSEVGKNQKKVGETQKKETEIQKKKTEAVYSLKAAANAMGGRNSRTIKLISELADRSDVLARSFKSLATGPTASATISLLGLAAAADYIVEYLSTSVSLMNDFYNSGITFAGGMAEMRMSAAMAAVSLDEFSKVIMDRSAVFTKMGSSGIRDFSLMSRQVRNSLQGMGQLGMKTDELNHYLGEYLEQQRQAQTLDTMTRSQQASAATEYMKSLDMWSVSLGKSKKELEGSSKKMTEGVQIQAALRAMPAEIRQTVMDNLKRAGPAFDALGPEFSNMMKEMVATGGRPMSEYGKMFIASAGPLGTEIQDFVSRMRSGTMSNKEMQEAMARMRKQVGPVAGELSELVGQLGETDPALAGVVNSLLEFERSSDKAKGPQDNFQSSMNDLREAGKDLLGAFDELIAAVFGGDGVSSAIEWFANFIRDPVIPLIKDFANWLRESKEAFAPWITGIAAVAGILGVLNIVMVGLKLIGWLLPIMGFFGKVVAMLFPIFGALGTGMGFLIKAFMFVKPILGVLMAFSAPVLAIIAGFVLAGVAIHAIATNWDSITKWFGDVWDAIINLDFKKLFQLWIEGISGIWSGLGNSVTTLLKDLFNVDFDVNQFVKDLFTFNFWPFNKNKDEIEDPEKQENTGDETGQGWFWPFNKNKDASEDPEKQENTGTFSEGGIQEFAAGGMGDFGRGSLAMLHGTEAVIPTVGNKVPVDVSVKLDPIQINPEKSTNDYDINLMAKDSTIRELVEATKELIEISKHQVGVTSSQTKELSKNLRSGFGDLEGTFAG